MFVWAIWHVSDWYSKNYPCPHPLSHLHYPFIFIRHNILSIFFSWIYLYIHSRIYYMDEYIQTFIRENADNWIYSDIHSWVIGSNKYIRIFIRQRKMTFATHWHKCHQNKNVTKTQIIPKRKCHQKQMSPKGQCHQNANVTKTQISPLELTFVFLYLPNASGKTRSPDLVLINPNGLPGHGLKYKIPKIKYINCFCLWLII